MLQLVQFENGHYGLQNQWTGIVINKQFRTKFGARRYASKATHKLNKTIGKINKRMVN